MPKSLIADPPPAIKDCASGFQSTVDQNQPKLNVPGSFWTEIQMQHPSFAEGQFMWASLIAEGGQQLSLAGQQLRIWAFWIACYRLICAHINEDDRN